MVCDCSYCFSTHFYSPPVQPASGLAPLIPLPHSPASRGFHVGRLKSVWRELQMSEQQERRALHVVHVRSLPLANSACCSPRRFASTLVALVRFGYRVLSSPQETTEPPPSKDLRTSLSTFPTYSETVSRLKPGVQVCFFRLYFSFVLTGFLGMAGLC